MNLATVKPYLALGAMAATGLAAAGASTALSVRFVGQRHEEQYERYPDTVVLKKGGKIVEKGPQDNGKRAAIAGVVGLISVAALSALFRPPATAQALLGRELVRGLTEATLLGTAAGIGAGAIIAYDAFDGSTVRPDNGLGSQLQPPR